MTEYEKMMNGELYDGSDADMLQVRDRALKLTTQINTCADFATVKTLFKRLFKHVGDEVVIQPPFYCEFGKEVSIGDHTFINMGVTMLDGAKITIGSNVMIGPATQFYTPSHSLDYLRRRKWETFCKPITIEDDVWIGGHVVINQGVTIGARSVVAANSVVNSDVSPDTLVGGAPAKVIRQLR